MEPRDQAGALRRALQRHRDEASPFYDEAVNEVATRAAQSGSLGNADIGALVAWKRLNANTRWAGALMNTPDDTVREATRASRLAALSGDRDVRSAASAARSALTRLPGFSTGDALASAVIYALAPDRMAVYDRRAQAGLERIDLKLTPKPGRYGRYMELVEHLIAVSRKFGSELTAREVDLALYTLGGPEH